MSAGMISHILVSQNRTLNTMSLLSSSQSVVVDSRTSPSLAEVQLKVDSKSYLNANSPDHPSIQSPQDDHLRTPPPVAPSPTHIPAVFDDFDTYDELLKPVVDQVKSDQEVCREDDSYRGRHRPAVLCQTPSPRSSSPYDEGDFDHTTYIALDDTSEIDLLDNDQRELHVSILDDEEDSDQDSDNPSEDSFMLVDPSFQIPTLRVFDNNGPLEKRSDPMYSSPGRYGRIPLFWEGADMGYSLDDHV